MKESSNLHRFKESYAQYLLAQQGRSASYTVLGSMHTMFSDLDFLLFTLRSTLLLYYTIIELISKNMILNCNIR